MTGWSITGSCTARTVALKTADPVDAAVSTTARDCGFDAHVTKGPGEARQVLADHGLMKD